MRIALERRHLFRDKIERRIDVTALHCQKLRRAVTHMAQYHVLEMCRATPVMRIAREHDLRIAGPAHESERSGAG